MLRIPVSAPSSNLPSRNAASLSRKIDSLTSFPILACTPQFATISSSRSASSKYISTPLFFSVSQIRNRENTSTARSRADWPASNGERFKRFRTKNKSARPAHHPEAAQAEQPAPKLFSLFCRSRNVRRSDFRRVEAHRRRMGNFLLVFHSHPSGQCSLDYY